MRILSRTTPHQVVVVALPQMSTEAAAPQPHHPRPPVNITPTTDSADTESPPNYTYEDLDPQFAVSRGAAAPPTYDEPSAAEVFNAVGFSGPHGKFPVVCSCPHCGVLTETKVTKETGMLPWIISLGMCITCTWCCACFVFTDEFKVITHRCGSCGAVIGQRRRL